MRNEDIMRSSLLRFCCLRRQRSCLNFFQRILTNFIVQEFFESLSNLQTLHSEFNPLPHLTLVRDIFDPIQL